jgi:23S rRNA (uridine2552-2'-O)-methyltransferase
MSGKDEYYNRSKVEGYRARSAFKLKQLDEAGDLLSDGDTVVDLGAAPGGWMQVAAEAVGEDGTVVGVDFQRIDPLDVAATVETVRGDMTEPKTRERVREAVRDATGADHDEGERGGPVDVVVSDLAPEMTGEYNLDQARSVHLARQAFETAEELLATGGHFVGKVFQGQDVDELVADV